MIEITNCGNECENVIKDYLYIQTDIGKFADEMARQVMIDFTIYGYLPWDYLEELKLNIKYQKLK